MTYLEDAASSAATAANEVQALRAVENAQVRPAQFSFAIQLLKPLTRRVHLQRAELRAERLQHRLDESLDANKTLRHQLSESSASLTHAMQQLRKFQGTTDKAAAPKNTAQSVPQLQRTIDGLRERLAHEKRSADAARAASAEHASKIPPLVAGA